MASLLCTIFILSLIDQELKQNNVHDPEMWSALKAELEARLSQLQTKNAELSE